MKIFRPLIALGLFGTIALCGCGALSDTANGGADQSAQSQPTPAPAAPAVEDKTLEIVPTTTVLEGKTVTLLTLPSGIKYYDDKIGTGPAAKDGDSINMQYTGMLLNQKVFDSTSSRGGTPFTFVLGVGQVIKGWDLGVAGMKVGGQRRLVIPGALAYGPSGQGSTIPPNATLIFDCKLASIGKGPVPPRPGG